MTFVDIFIVEAASDRIRPKQRIHEGSAAEGVAASLGENKLRAISLPYQRINMHKP